MGRVPAGGGLRIDEIPLRHDLEAAAAGGDHLDFDVREPISEGGRQTGGLRFVVSSDAVFDGYMHPCRPFRRPFRRPSVRSDGAWRSSARARIRSPARSPLTLYGTMGYLRA